MVLSSSEVEHWGLWPLAGGRNNEVYSWAGPETPICIKLYTLDERRRAQREWHALTLLAQYGADYAPAPLWIDEASEAPAIGMSLLPGRPLPDVEDVTVALKALAEITRAVCRKSPLNPPLATWDRIDSVEHYLAHVTELWPQQLADHPNDPLTDQPAALGCFHGRCSSLRGAEAPSQLLGVGALSHRGEVGSARWLSGVMVMRQVWAGGFPAAFQRR